MAHRTAFVIEWSISEAQWEKTRGAAFGHSPRSGYDRHALARNYLLYGDVDLVCDDVRLYGGVHGGRGVNISVLDLAVCLSAAYLNQSFAEGRGVTYQQLDDDRSIRFRFTNGIVKAVASDRSEVLLVEHEQVVAGVAHFSADWPPSAKTKRSL